jgi:hypothetical protein
MLARRSDKTVVAWGNNNSGQCDVPPPPPGTYYTVISAGQFFSMALTSQGQIVGWGQNGLGQLNVPPLPPGMTYIDVGAGFREVLATRSDGSLVAWGLGSNCQTTVPAVPPGKAALLLDPSRWNAVVLLGDCGSVTPYCAPAGANSVSPTGAALSARGCPSMIMNKLILDVVDLPTNSVGIVFFGPQPASVPFGNGTLCIGGAIKRVLPAANSGSVGAVAYALDFGDPDLADLEAGSTFDFQYWYRDPAGSPATFNVSSALEILFVP